MDLDDTTEGLAPVVMCHLPAVAADGMIAQKKCGNRRRTCDHSANQGRAKSCRWFVSNFGQRSPNLRKTWRATLPTFRRTLERNDPLASRAAVKRVDFKLDGPVNVMIDGESLRLECRALEILPGAMDIIV